jgi:hypothetical protein
MGGDAKGRGVSGRPASPGCRADVLEWLERLLGNRPEVTQGKMFGFPAFYTAGRLFACVYGEGVGLKLPREMVRQLDGLPGISPFRPYGKAEMKEWVHIRRARVRAYAKDAHLFRASIAFVAQAARPSGKSGPSQRLRKQG